MLWGRVLDHTMTGTGFKHLASVCAANVTCLSDSYWHAVATTLASDTAANEVSGAAGATGVIGDSWV